MKASDRQEGGQHYKDFPIQPAEFCQRNRLNWCEANVVKYVCRHASKKGAEDLLKAKHYIDLLLEWEYPIPEGLPAERKASLCHSCHAEKCDTDLIHACEESGTCDRYISSLRERVMDAKEEKREFICTSCWRLACTKKRILAACGTGKCNEWTPADVVDPTEETKPAPVALEICPSCSEHPGCKGTVEPAADGSCKGFSPKKTVLDTAPRECTGGYK